MVGSAGADLQVEFDELSPDDPAAVLSIGWGYVQGEEPSSGGIALSFYTRSEYEDIAPLVQTVSGIEIVFFTTEKFLPLFEGKALDHSDDRGFFLR